MFECLVFRVIGVLGLVSLNDEIFGFVVSGLSKFGFGEIGGDIGLNL